MKKWWIMLLAAMLACLLPANALAIGSYPWDENQVYVISGTQNGTKEIATKNDDEYFLVLDHVVMNGRISIEPMSPSYNQSPTVHVLVKGENRISSSEGPGFLSMGGTIQFVFEPASWDASLVVEGGGRHPIDTRVFPSINGFRSVYSDFETINKVEYHDPEYIVPIPGGSSKPVPATGDHANLILWGGMLAVSIIGIVALGRKAGKEY